MGEQCEKMVEDSQFIHPPFPHFSYLNTPKTNSLNFCHFTTTSAPVTFANTTIDVSDNYSNPYINPTPMNPLVSAAHPCQPPLNHSFSNSTKHSSNRAYEERMEVLEMPIGVDNLAGVSKSFSGDICQNETLWDPNDRNTNPQEISNLSPTHTSVPPHINNFLNNSKTNNLVNTSNTNNNFMNQHVHQFLQETNNNNTINPAIFAAMTAPTMMSWHPPIPYRSLHSMKIPPECLAASKAHLTHPSYQNHPCHYHPYQSNDKNSEKRDQNLTHMMKNHPMSQYLSNIHQVTNPIEAMIINNIQNTISNSYAYKAGRTISSNNLVNNPVSPNEKNFDAVTARRTHSAPSGKSKQKNSYLDEIFSNSLVQNNNLDDEDDSENEEEDENGHSIIGVNPKVVNELLNNINYIPAHNRSKSNEQINFQLNNMNNNNVYGTPVHRANSANNFDSTNANFNRDKVFNLKNLKGINQKNSFQHSHSIHPQENVNNNYSEELDDSNEEDDTNINFEILDDDDYEKMSVKHLKQRCKSLGLLISGNKSQLIERLKNPQNSIRKRKRSVKSFANTQGNSLPGDVKHSSNSLVNPLINHPNNSNASQNTSNLPIFTPNFTNEPSNFNNGKFAVHNIPISGNDDKLKAMKKIKQQERKARPESKEKLVFTSKYKLAKVNNQNITNNNQTSSNNNNNNINNNNTHPTITANGVSCSVDNCDKDTQSDVKNIEATMKKRGKKNTEQSKFIFHFSNNTKIKHGSKRNRNHRNQKQTSSDPVNNNNTRQSNIKENDENENDIERGENSNSNSEDEEGSSMI